MVTLPIKPINRLIKHHYRGDISQETSIAFRDILIDFSNILAKLTAQEFSTMNRRRQTQGLPPLKRLDKTSLKTVWERILNQITDKNIVGEVGNYNTTLLCRDGVTNETKT